MAGILMLFALLSLGTTAVWAWALVDSISRPEWVFQQQGSNKTLWIVLTIVLGVLGGAIYLLAVRPRLARAQATMSPGIIRAAGFPGLQPAYAGSPPPAAWTADYCPNCTTPFASGGLYCGACGAPRPVKIPGSLRAPGASKVSDFTADKSLPAIDRSQLLALLPAAGARELSAPLRRAMKAPLEAMPSLLGPAETVVRLVGATCQHEEGLLVLTDARFLFFDGLTGILEMEFAADATVAARGGRVEISDEYGGARFDLIDPTTAPEPAAARPLAAPVRLCVRCGSEFTPVFLGTTCPDCGGTLRPTA